MVRVLVIRTLYLESLDELSSLKLWKEKLERKKKEKPKTHKSRKTHQENPFSRDEIERLPGDAGGVEHDADDDEDDVQAEGGEEQHDHQIGRAHV